MATGKSAFLRTNSLAVDQLSCKSEERQLTQSTTSAGPHAILLMKTCASIISAGFVRMKSLTKPEQTLAPALWSMMTVAKGNGRPSVMKKERNIHMNET